MKWFRRLGMRERQLMLVTVVFVGCCALITWLVQPLWNHMEDLRRRVSSQSDKLEGLARLMGQASDVDSAYEAMGAYIERSPDEGSKRDFLDELEQLSRRSRLQLNLKPRLVKRNDQAERFEVELEVDGSQSQLLGFLDDLLDMQRLVAIERLRLATLPAKRDRLRLNLIVDRIILR